MNHNKDWQIENTNDSEKSDRPQSHVQAWARDSCTGEPVYIMELGPHRRGSRCGCECQSCNLPLTAVNAAKSEYIKRPHFRHPHGTEKSACMFLAARLAALQLLRDQGVLELPARKVSGRVAGLSGTLHEVWIEHPIERLKIRDFDFRDKVWALITFEDGRQLRFNLIGSGVINEKGQVIPSISLDLDNVELAGMSLEELRKRTTLLADGLCWNSHWKDAELQMQADKAALATALNFLDIEGEFENDLADIQQDRRRETLLHLEVKKILSEARYICTPEIQCYVLRTADDGYDIEKSVNFPSATIPIEDVILEKRFGGLIPDVTAKTNEEHGRILFIEVTVTHVIDAERQRQIILNNVPALEIDLSRVGGLISRAELRELVVNNIECKRWLCHPKVGLCQHEIELTADAELQERNDAIQARDTEISLIKSIPLNIIARDYLDAIESHQNLVRDSRNEDLDKVSQALSEIRSYANRLAVHGFPEANDHDLHGTRSQIIPRILAIRRGGGVGYDLDSTMGIMNAIKQSQVNNRKFHTIYLIAVNVYQGLELLNSPAWYRAWVDEIKKQY